MKIPNSFIILLLLFVFISSKAFCWEGYDYESDSEIEIESGNLVREGELIKFYDWRSEDYHRGEVNSVENRFNGTRLEIYDLELQKERIFDMQ
jgi:hypothetical protein